MILLFKRFMAFFYDALLVLSLLMIGTLSCLLFTGGQAIPLGNVLYQFFLFALIFLFFVGFWMKGGQTTGLRAWKLRVVSQTQRSPSFKQASIRFMAGTVFGLSGIGWVWAVFDKEKRTLYDRLSQTQLIPDNKR